MELIVPFDKLDRNTAPERLAPGAARILQNVDTELYPGRTVRARGYARTQLASSSSTVTGAFVITRGDCKRIVIDGNTGGAVRITPGDQSKCCGPLPLWQDRANPNSDDDPTDAPDWGNEFEILPANTVARFVFNYTGTPAANGNTVGLGIYAYVDPDSAPMVGIHYLGTGYIAEADGAGIWARADGLASMIEGYFTNGAYYTLNAFGGAGAAATHSLYILADCRINSTDYAAGDVISGTYGTTYLIE